MKWYSIPKPDARTHACSHQSWLANDVLASAFITTYVTNIEREFLDLDKSTVTNWKVLKDCYEKEGLICQINLLIQALTMKCSKDIPLPKTTAKICILMECAFAMGMITLDLLHCITLLNSLTDFPSVHSHVLYNISAAPNDKPYTSRQIRNYLEGKQALLDNDRSLTIDSVALAACMMNVTKSTPPTCANCKKKGHSMTYCISPGGGMAGKLLDESKEAQRKDRDVRQGKEGMTSGGKVSLIMTGANGQAFSVLENKKDIPSIQDTTHGNEFAGFVTSALNTLLNDLEHLEYDGYMAWLEEEPTIAS